MIERNTMMMRTTEVAPATDQLLAAQLKAIGLPVRICILRTLLTHARGTLCVEDLRDELLLRGYDIAQPTLHLLCGSPRGAGIAECAVW